ncbi:MAG: SDR family NAD(P)-dependent oxidoreductase [Chloroflexi bacterium]|nr:SDR family NAD(P)-dependent oxidoreductase [Chloroflexota bacterium]
MSVPLFYGKVALVTGGSRGIGRAITLALAQAGCTVVFCYRAEHAAATALCQTAHAQAWPVSALCADVSNRPAVDQLIADVLAMHGRIDILVNNAGRFPRQSVLEMSDDDWENVLRTNLFSAFYCARAVLPTMIAANAGVIINIASIAGQRGSAYHAHYAAAKGGLLAFTRSLAREVIAHNIRVNAVAPGRISTEMLLEEVTDSEQERWRSDTPIRRLGTPEEVAAAVVFLASPASSYMVGETLSVNGGLLMD